MDNLPSVTAGLFCLRWGFLGQCVSICVRLLSFNTEHVKVTHGAARSLSSLSSRVAA